MNTAENSNEKSFFSDNLLDQILSRISDGFVAFDKEFNYTYVNAPAGKMLGRKPEELIGKNYWIEFPEAHNTPFANAYIKAMETQKPIVLEDYFKPWDRWFENRIFPSNQGLTIFFTEITARKLNEKKTSDHEQLIEMITNTAPAIIYVYDLIENKNIYSNSGIQRLLGYTVHQVQEMGSEVLSLLAHPDDFPKIVDFQNKIKYAKESEVFEIEYRMKHANGNWISLKSYERAFVMNTDGIVLQKIGVAIDISHGFKAAEELKKEKRFLDSLFDSLTEGIVACDENGKLTRFNKATINYHGLPKADIPPEKWANYYNLFHSDGITPLTKEEVPLFHALKNGSVSNAEFMIIPKNGIARHFVANGQQLKDDKGNFFGAVAAMHDITDRLNSIEKLKQSEERFKKAFITSPDSININRLSDGLYIEINEGFTTITGYSREDVVGKTSAEINIWENLNDRQRLVEGLKKHGKVINLEAKFRTKDGTILIGLMSASIISFNNEPHILSISRDITQFKTAQTELQTSEAKYRSFIENSMDAIILEDPSGSILSSNNAACKMFGCSETEIINKGRNGLLDLTDPRLSIMLAERNEKGFVRSEINMIRNDGTIFPAEIASALFTDSENNQRSSLIIRDITSQKEQQQAISTLNEELEQRVKERTLDLENANKDLEAINDLFVGREMRIIELKEEIERLKQQLK